MRTQVFQDFEAFADSVDGVESKMMLRNPIRRLWRTRSIDLGQIHVQIGELGSGNIAQGQLRPDGFLWYLPLTDAVEYSANGCSLEDGSFVLLEPGCEFCVSTKVAHDWCSVFIPTRMLAADDKLVVSAERSCRVTRPKPQAARQFRALVNEIVVAATHCSDFESSPAAERAAAEVQRLATLSVRQESGLEPKPEGRPKVARQEIIRRSLQRIEQCEGEHLCVCELATAANVSERTLRTAFNEYFGLGPVRYLQLRQLNRIRQALLAADSDEVTVTKILIEHDEWDFSRFASRYRRIFGELPSETLRSKAAS